MHLDFDSLDIFQKSWNYGMKTIAENVIAKKLNIEPDQVLLTNADYEHLIFKGYDPQNMEISWKLHLKISGDISFEMGDKHD